MDPIAAFRQFVPPGVTARAPKTLDNTALTRGLIPAAELQKLNPELGLDPTNQATHANSFEGTLARLVSGVNDKQTAAADTVRALTSGQNVSLHQAMISMEEASVSFQLMVEVRNKLLESYQELMRMQI